MVTSLPDDKRAAAALATSATLAGTAPRDVVLSADGLTLYAAGKDGVLRAYSMSSGELAASWRIGSQLGAIDLSPDGTFLMIAEETFVSAPGDSVVLTSYRFDLATQNVQTYSTTNPEATYGVFLDLAVLSDGSVLLGRKFGGFSQILDLQTGQYTNGPYLGSYSIFSSTEDGSKVLIADGGSSAGGLAIFQPGAGTTATATTDGFNFGSQAISSSTGYVAQWIYNLGIRIYDPVLQHQITLTNWKNGAVEGLIFDKDGKSLFILDNVTDSIVQVAVPSWTVIKSIPVGSNVGKVSGQVATNLGNKLLLDPTGSFFTVLTETGLVAVAHPDAPERVGTSGPDTISGFLFSDRIDGGGGNDRIDGGNGNDILRGGDGDDVILGGGGADLLEGGAGADRLEGGPDADVYIVDDARDVVIELSFGGVDEVRTDLLVFTLPPEVEWLTSTAAGSHTYYGNEASNLINLTRGGIDTVFGGGGDDGFIFGASFTAADKVDGGAGENDQVALQGDYSAGLTFGGESLVSVETVLALPGFDYRLTTVDGNVAVGGRLQIFGTTLGANDDLTFDGSAETNGYFVFYGGAGKDTLTGGAGNDGFYFGPGNFSQTDTLHGGAGNNDQLGLDGHYSLTLGGNFDGIETLVLYRGPEGDLNRFNLTTNDAAVAAGQRFTIFGTTLGTGLVFDGSAESDGSFRFLGSQNNDMLTGGKGDDLFFGGRGGDTMNGGGGNDVFVYNSAAESTASSFDRILGFGAGDRIDLSGIDANSGTPENDAFAHIGANAFSGAAGELRLFEANGSWTIEGDNNGDKLADLMINVTTDNGHIIVPGDFMF